MNSSLRTVLVVTLALIALPLLWGVLMTGGSMMGGSMMGGVGPGMMWGGQGVDGGWRWSSLFMMLPAALILAAVVAVVVWGLGSAGGSATSGHPDARSILDARYARGELTRDEYQRMRGDLDA